VVVKSRNQHVKVVEVDEERKSEPVDDYLNWGKKGFRIMKKPFVYLPSFFYPQ
jgi:hypothetical protein